MTTSHTMQGKICLVTGATSGIGKATALGLAHMGATLVLVARSKSKGEEVRQEIARQSGNENIDVLFADLSSQQDVRKLAGEFQAKYTQLYVLVNSAGAVFSTRQTTVDGLEMTFALDHLAYFLLTNLLLDTLKASRPARIINISSEVQAFGKIHFDDLQSEKSYGFGFGAYNQAKLANVLFTYELARHLQGTGITVNAVGPGSVDTNFAVSNGGVFGTIAKYVKRVANKTPAYAARTVIRLASAPEMQNETGKFYYHEREIRSSKLSHNEAIQKQLWEVSEHLTKTVIPA